MRNDLNRQKATTFHKDNFFANHEFVILIFCFVLFCYLLSFVGPSTFPDEPDGLDDEESSKIDQILKKWLRRF
jgi:hypothetical protein